jgi:putative MATE family efflux protein
MGVLVSQFWGIKDTETIRKSFGMGLLNTLAISIIASFALFFFTPQLLGIFTNDPLVITEGAKYVKIACWSFIPMSIAYIFSYLLRSTEIVILPLITTIISVMLNTALNYLLIFGNFGFPRMGIRGAALATLISSTVQLLLVTVISYAKKNVAAAKVHELFAFGKTFVKKYYKLALPVLANEVLWATGVNVYNMVLGRLGSDNYAAFTIYGSIEQLFFTFFIGVCTACAVIIGKMVGRGELDEAYITARKFMIYGTLLAFGMGIMTLLLRNAIIALVSVPDPYTAQMISKLLFIYAFAVPLYILPYIAIVGVFRAGGDTKIGLLYDIINVWFIGVPLVAVTGLLLKWPFEYVFIAMWTEHIIKSIMCIKYFISKKWIRRVTENVTINT